MPTPPPTPETRITFRLPLEDQKHLITDPMAKAGISKSAQIIRALRFAGEFMPEDYALDEEMYVKAGVRQFKRSQP